MSHHHIQEHENQSAPSATEEGRRPTGVAEGASRQSSPQSAKSANPEVIIRSARRRFTATYKLSILEEMDRAATGTERGAIMRREGLYSSQICEWRKARSNGALSALSKKRGAKPKHSPQDKQIELLKAENKRLQAKLAEAEAIVDIQKKVSEILGNKIQTIPSSEKTS